MYRWAGFSTSAEPAGVAPPLTALSMASSGIGNIVGSYFAYSRFLDKFGNISNLSPVSAQLDAKGGRTIQITAAVNSPSALISAATNATPIVCTSAAHGRATNQVVKITGGTGLTAINGTWTITVVNVNQFRLNGSVGNGVYNANTATWKLQTPMLITTAVAHGLQVGASVVIAGVLGNTDANGTWTVLTVPSSTTFTISQTSGGNGAYTSGGVITTGTFGVISDATATTPIVITSNGHGLTTGLLVKITDVLGNDDANGTWSISVIDQNKFSLDGSSGVFAFSPSPSAIWTSGGSTITFSSVPVPVESKVTRRQILRNTDGQAKTFYVDVDTTSLLATSFTSTRSDSDLSAQEAVPFFDVTGASVVNLHTVPPNWKAFVVAHQDRMFYLGEVAYSEGNAVLTNGSKTVTGIATSWPATFAGRFLYVDGAPQSYEIASADFASQTLTLVDFYLGPTSNYSFYSVRPAPAERRLVYFSEAGQPESVPATNALALEEDNDDITGGLSFRSFLYLLERRHIYRLTFQQDPGTDGAVYLAGLRGCINQRCAVIVEDGVYMLDEQGVHLFDGGEGGQNVSDQIQSFFRPDPDEQYQINWTSQRFFHCLANRTHNTIRWFVALAGDYLPRHALCYSYVKKRWWVEEFKVPVGSSALGRIGPVAGWQSGVEQMYLGSQFKQVLKYWTGQLDGNPSGKTSGSVSSSTFAGLSDRSGAFISAWIGLPVTITSGRGKGQTRVISSILSTTEIQLSWPWNITPDSTSTYQVGGVPWEWLSGSRQLALSEDNQQQGFEVEFQPTDTAMTMDMRRFVNFEDDPEAQGEDWSSEQQLGVATEKDDPDMVVDLSKSTKGKQGYAKKAMTGRREGSVDGVRRVSFELRGVTGPEPVTVYRVGMEGVEGASR